MELESLIRILPVLLGFTAFDLARGHGSHHHPGQGHGGPGGHGGQGHHHGGSPEERPSGLYDPKVIHDQEHILEHYEGRAKFNESQMSPEELEFHYFKLHDFDNNTKLDGLEILKALTHLLPYEDIHAQGQQGGQQGQGHHGQGHGQAPPQGHGQAPQGHGQAPQGHGQAPQGHGGHGQAPQGHDQGQQGVPQIERDAAGVAKERAEAELKYYMDIVDSVLEEDDLDRDGYLTYLEYVLARKREEAREMQENRQRGAPQQQHNQHNQHRGRH